MDPTTIQLLLGLPPTAYSLYKSLFTKPEELPADFWKKYYSPERIQAGVEPMRLVLEQEAGKEIGQEGERWGGKGLLSTAGAEASRRAVEREKGSKLQQVMSQALAGEMGTAATLGLGEWARKHQEDKARTSMWGQLGGQLMAPQFGRWGREAGYEEIKKQLEGYGETEGGMDTINVLAALLSSQMGGQAPTYSQEPGYMNPLMQWLIQEQLKRLLGTSDSQYSDSQYGEPFEAPWGGVGGT